MTLLLGYYPSEGQKAGNQKITKFSFCPVGAKPLDE